VDLLLTSEQEAIMSSSAAFLAAEAPIAGIRQHRSEPASIDRSVWTHCAELGWFALGLPEAKGGVGYTLAEEAVLFREIGRGLAPGPFVATVLGARLAAQGGPTPWSRSIIEGTAVVGLAQPRAGTTAEVGPLVSGEFDLIDAAGAELILVVGDDGMALVEATQLGPVETLDCLDPGVRLGSSVIDQVPSLPVADHHDETLFERGSILVSALQVGVAEATRDMATAYAKERVQFGKPIGAQQAIKHRCADMAVRAEAAGSQLLFGALCSEMGRADAAFQAAAARVVADEAAITNSQENIQVHGGIGYTFEHDANLFMRRAQVLARLLGDARRALEALVQLPAPL
jgi:alkylation response protein AidB-like acyl-CoA dehydrogenase